MESQQVTFENVVNLTQQLSPLEKLRLIERLTLDIEILLTTSLSTDCLRTAKGGRDKSVWLGCMVGTGEIVGDIVSPVIEENEWEVLRK